MDGGDDLATSLSLTDPGTSSGLVTDLAEKQGVVVRAHEHWQQCREPSAVRFIDFELGEPGEVALDRVFDRPYGAVWGRHTHQCRVGCGGLPRTHRSGNEDHAVGVAQKLMEEFEVARGEL